MSDDAAGVVDIIISAMLLLAIEVNSPPFQTKSVLFNMGDTGQPAVVSGFTGSSPSVLRYFPLTKAPIPIHIGRNSPADIPAYAP